MSDVTLMEVQLSRQRRVERQVEPSAMTLSTGVYWIPVLHDACRSALTASSVSTFKVSQYGHVRQIIDLLILAVSSQEF